MSTYITTCDYIHLLQGITFNPNRLVVPTKKPHIVLDFASKHGKQHEMQEVLFRAYFSDGRDVSSDDVLKELVSEVGLDPDQAMAAIADKEYVREFDEGIKESKIKGDTAFRECRECHYHYFCLQQGSLVCLTLKST